MHCRPTYFATGRPRPNHGMPRRFPSPHYLAWVFFGPSACPSDPISLGRDAANTTKCPKCNRMERPRQFLRPIHTSTWHISAFHPSPLLIRRHQRHLEDLHASPMRLSLHPHCLTYYCPSSTPSALAKSGACLRRLRPPVASRHLAQWRRAGTIPCQIPPSLDQVYFFFRCAREFPDCSANLSLIYPSLSTE